MSISNAKSFRSVNQSWQKPRWWALQCRDLSRSITSPVHDMYQLVGFRVNSQAGNNKKWYHSSLNGRDVWLLEMQHRFKRFSHLPESVANLETRCCENPFGMLFLATDECEIGIRSYMDFVRISAAPWVNKRLTRNFCPRMSICNPGLGFTIAIYALFSARIRNQNQISWDNKVASVFKIFLAPCATFQRPRDIAQFGAQIDQGIVCGQ